MAKTPQIPKLSAFPNKQIPAIPLGRDTGTTVTKSPYWTCMNYNFADNWQYIMATAFDSKGNVYVAIGPIKVIENQPLSATDEFYIVKHNPNGELEWSLHYDTMILSSEKEDGYAYIFKVGLDDRLRIVIDDGTYHSYVEVIEPDGTLFLRYRNTNSSTHDVTDVAGDKDGNTYVVYFNVLSGQNPEVKKVDTTGTAVWNRRCLTGGEESWDVDVSPYDGEIYVSYLIDVSTDEHLHVAVLAASDGAEQHERKFYTTTGTAYRRRQSGMSFDPATGAVLLTWKNEFAGQLDHDLLNSEYHDMALYFTLQNASLVQRDLAVMTFTEDEPLSDVEDYRKLYITTINPRVNQSKERFIVVGMPTYGDFYDGNCQYMSDVGDGREGVLISTKSGVAKIPYPLAEGNYGAIRLQKIANYNSITTAAGSFGTTIWSSSADTTESELGEIPDKTAATKSDTVSFGFEYDFSGADGGASICGAEYFDT